ncbi:DUF6268 family outer membrane beta-barrel protein [Christiangramia aquimixticola]|uniref:DUF6268 family outer membrane beta-barrel protein n=1 Tax=Christiangramia aquimixticola TaxID=1697558 RepID=UPI003AA95878
MKIKGIIICICLWCGLASDAQNADLARIEYTYFPQKDSDNSFRRFRALAAYPIKLKKEGSYLIPGIEFRNVSFKYRDAESFSTAGLENFKAFTATLGYTFELGQNWRFGAEGGLKLASNFSESSFNKDDLIYTGAVVFIKSGEDDRFYEPSRLILGLHYSTTAGFPLPIPIVNYYRRWDEKWSYMVGPPKSNLKYYINEKHELELFVTLDGFFANIQKNLDTEPGVIQPEHIAANISMTILLSGIGYEYGITDHLKLYVYGGHTILNNIRLRDGNKDEVFTINDKNTFYARSGLKFTIF